jgi:peptidoglycan/xylan/chitin deacetylase (PgdA/CDA1 family)
MFHHFHSDDHLASQGSLDEKQFASMLDWLGQRYSILSAADYLKKFEKQTLADRDICISFDDALLCQYDVARPILNDRGLTAFYFVYSSVFGGSPDLLEVYRYFRTNCFASMEEFYAAFFKIVADHNAGQYAEARAEFDQSDYLAAFPFYTNDDRWFRYLRDQLLGPERYEQTMANMMRASGFDIAAASRKLWMSEDDLRSLHDEGNLIGLHSYSHPTQMSKLSKAEQTQQYRQNMDHLETVLGKGSVSSMSHPCGDYNTDTLELLNAMGIRIGFRSSLSQTHIASKLEIPRDDHANILKAMNA